MNRKGECLICGEPARLYPGGWRCDRHSPWAQRGITIPKPPPGTTLDERRRAAQQRRQEK